MLDLAAPHTPKKPAWQSAAAAVALLVVHASLLAWSATRHSPSIDEVGHMAAGLSHWKFGRFDLYRVNPPLARLAATLPVFCSGPNTSWNGYSLFPGSRSEFECGEQFIMANGQRSFWLFALARWACIPFSLLGGYVCYRWARDLYGAAGGLLALTLWCFSPNILAHAQMITPDVPATALGVAAFYLFSLWLRAPSWRRAFTTGVVLGLAELTKTTFLALYALWPLAWFVWRFTSVRKTVDPAFQTDERQAARPARRQAAQLAFIALLSVYIINLGYAFEGSFQPLGQFHFISQALGGPRDMTRSESRKRNRFAETALASLRVPLPANYVLGIDQQKFDFEVGYRSYLRGEWRHGGWWYYYLYGLAVKGPLGTWVLVAIALGSSLARVARRRSAESVDTGPPARDARSATTSAAHASQRPVDEPGLSNWRDTFLLLLPVAAILALVSSQTGFNHHLRYVLPIFPFVFIWMGRLGGALVVRRPATVRPRRRQGPVPAATALVAAALVWSVGSSLWFYPHSLSYFNELAGGPLGGPRHLLDSNIDWGQDLLYLKRWVDDHPEARSLGLAYFGRFDPRAAGIEFSLPPVGPTDADDAPSRQTRDLGPRPGWYAVSVMILNGYKYQIPDGNGGMFNTDQPYFNYFQHFEPVARAGYSIYIYHIDLDQANRVRQMSGLPPLTDDTDADGEPDREQG